MRIEEFFDLRIATVERGEVAPAGAHLVRIENPSRAAAARLEKAGWFYKPSFVSYVLQVPVSLDRYIESAFASPARSKPRRLLRDVPGRYRLRAERDGRSLDQFVELYRRTIVSRARGRDRLAEHGELRRDRWLGLYLFDGARMVAGILAHGMGGHLSVAYGAFDPEHRRFDLEHFLLMQALQASIDRGCEWMSLGMDTNRYGHHLSLRLPPYKLRIGFTPVAYEPAGREAIRIASLEPFEEGLFFYGYRGEGLVGHYISRSDPDLRPFRHRTSPPILAHRI
jgi:hypothetical protein